MIITANNFLPLHKIQEIKNGDIDLDVILYTDIFNATTTKKITKVLETLLYTDNKAWFTDNINLIYNKIEPTPFPAFLDHIRDDVEQITGRPLNSCLINRIDNHGKLEYNISEELTGIKIIIPSILFGESRNIKYVSDVTSKTIDVRSGTLMIQRPSVYKYWSTNIMNNDKKESFIMTFFYIFPLEDTRCIEKNAIKRGRIPNDLKIIYLNTGWRKMFVENIKKGLSSIHNVPEGEQCIVSNGLNKLKKFVTLRKLVGTGDWGNVYSACLKSDQYCLLKFGLKMSRITEEDYKDPYTETSNAWYEIWMLKDIIKPIIENNICPNLPLFIDSFLCGKCDFIFRTQEKSHPCVVTGMELATGDMSEYLKYYTYTDEELYSALFQVMAGLHAIQMSGQILNNDIKARNILFYDVKPGGYWHYKIKSHDFYVPNYGKLFVLNDFGVSTLYNPNFQLYPNKKRQTFNLGSRYAININEKFSPINSSVEYSDGSLRRTSKIKWTDSESTYGATFRLDRQTDQVIVSHTTLSPIQKDYLFKNNVSTNTRTWGFFEHPYIVPPFEFYNDVQDTLRTFVGGKRATQKGNHTTFPKISENIKQIIKPYLGIAENSREKHFSLDTFNVLAGSFIIKFFTKTVNYTIKPKGRKISYYDINKCMMLGKKS